jgi:hypothetical protein
LSVVEFEAQGGVEALGRGAEAMPSTLTEALLQREALVDVLDNVPRSDLAAFATPEERSIAAGREHGRNRAYLTYGKALYATLGEINRFIGNGEMWMTPRAKHFLNIDPRTIMPTMPATFDFQEAFEASVADAIDDIEATIRKPFDLRRQLANSTVQVGQFLAIAERVAKYAHAPQLEAPEYLRDAYAYGRLPAGMTPELTQSHLDCVVEAHRRAWNDTIRNREEFVEAAFPFGIPKAPHPGPKQLLPPGAKYSDVTYSVPKSGGDQVAWMCALAMDIASAGSEIPLHDLTELPEPQGSSGLAR